MSDAQDAANRYRADRTNTHEISVEEWLGLGPNRRWSLIQLWVNGKEPGVSIEEIAEVCELVHSGRFFNQRETIVAEINALLTKYMSESDKLLLTDALTQRGFESIIEKPQPVES